MFNCTIEEQGFVGLVFYGRRALFQIFFASNLFPENMLFEQLCFYSLGCTFLMALSTQDVLSQANELGWDLPNGQLNV